MKINKRGLALSGLYLAFASYAIYAYWDETMFRFSGPLGSTKLLVWLALAGNRRPSALSYNDFYWPVGGVRVGRVSS